MSTPTIPSGLKAGGVTSNALTLSWNAARNPGTSLVTGPATGAWFGFDAAGDKQQLVAAESILSRSVDLYRADYNMSGRAKHTFPTNEDDSMYSGGRISTGEHVSDAGRVAVWSLTTLIANTRNPALAGALAGLTPGASSATYGGKGTNNVWTYIQISSGDLDAYFTGEFTRVAQWGMPALFVFEPHVEAATADHDAAGSPAEYVAAYTHLRALASAAGATNLAWTISYGDGTAGTSTYTPYYPGDSAVDWISWEPTNAPLIGGDWVSFAATLAPLPTVTSALGSGASAKPVLLNIGCGYDPGLASHRPTWLADVASELASVPTVKGLIYINSGPALLNIQTFDGGAWTDSGTADADSWTALAAQGIATVLNRPHEAGGTGVGGYRVYADDGPVATTTHLHADLTGYTAGTSHTFTVSAIDSSDPPVESAKSPGLDVTFAEAEPVAPSVPAGVTCTALNDQQIRVAWLPSTSNGSGVGGYRVYTDNALAGETNDVVLAVTGLTAETSYNISVAAGDTSLAAWSSQSVPVAVSTRPAADTTPPEPPAALTATATVSPATNMPSVLLMWPSSTSGDAVGYNLTRDGKPIAQTGGDVLRFQDAGTLRPGTTYEYAVTAFDAAKNISTPTATSVTTPAASALAPLAALTVSPSSGPAPLTVTADASASTDPNGASLTYAFGFGDGPSAGATRFASANNVYTTPGNYSVTVVVTNAQLYVDSVTVTVGVSAPEDRTPELNLYLPRPGDVLAGPGAKPFWDQIRAGLRTIDQAIHDLRHP